MSTINGNVCVVDGVPVDKVFSDGRQVYGKNLYLNSKTFKNDFWGNGGAKLTLEPFDSITNMYHVVAPQNPGNSAGMYIYRYADNLLSSNSNWSFSADVKGTGKPATFGIEAGDKKPVIGTVESEWSRISQTGWVGNNIKTIVMYFDTTGSPLDVYIKLPKLEKGSVATPWTPAPEDVLK